MAALILLVLFTAACGSDDDSSTTVEESEFGVTLEIIDEGEGSGTFTAAGDTTAERVVCSAGEWLVIGVEDADTGEEMQPATTENIRVTHTYTCEDGSGTFTLQHEQPIYYDDAQVEEAIETGAPVGTHDWEVVSGTDAYENLARGGTATTQLAEPGVEYPAIDTYTGSLSTS